MGDSDCWLSVAIEYRTAYRSRLEIIAAPWSEVVPSSDSISSYLVSSSKSKAVSPVAIKDSLFSAFYRKTHYTERLTIFCHAIFDSWQWTKCLHYIIVVSTRPDHVYCSCTIPAWAVPKASKPFTAACRREVTVPVRLGAG